MIRLSLFFAWLLLSLAVVAQDELVDYSISGTVPLGVKSVFLSSLRNEPIDTAAVENGKFLLKGSLPTLCYFIR